MHDWAVRPNDWNSNLMVLGDFNLDRIGDPALRSVHLHGPVAAHRTEHRPEDNLDDDKTQRFYDQIAWFSKADGTSLLQGLAYGQRGGPSDFIRHVYRGLTRNEVSWRISDHYPLWCELRTAPGHLA